MGPVLCNSARLGTHHKSAGWRAGARRDGRLHGRANAPGTVACQSHVSRRLVLCAPVVGAASASREAKAGPFGIELPWDGFLAQSPQSVRVPRKQLNLNFAILLMRSTYEAVDALDFIAMDKFQIKFWKLRQSEFESYKLLVDPLDVPVGNLASPLYFDFIAFSQYAAVSKEIPNAPQVFEEFCENCEGEAIDRPYRVVRRDAALADNKLLPQRLQLQVGRCLYDKMRSGFRGESFACPAPLTATAAPEALTSAVSELMQTFVANGFAINARVSDVTSTPGGGAAWRVRVEGGANLWGMQALQARRSLVADSFDAFAIQGFLDASGFEGKFKLEVNDTFVDQSWTASPRARTA